MNIKEIADMAGVSRATVSRYLNDGYVSEEKRERIRRVIEETGYQPSSQAQTLRTRKTKLVGVILPKINSDSVSRMVAGITGVGATAYGITGIFGYLITTDYVLSYTLIIVVAVAVAFVVSWILFKDDADSKGEK